MPESHGLDGLSAELDRWGAAGRTARLWLRDDDAVRPTPALEALIDRVRAHDAPCLVAVIPALASTALAGRLSQEPLLRVAMHGIVHANHAPEGRKTEETPAELGPARIRDGLAAARARLTAMFGPCAGDWYVPPWNRIGCEAAALLPSLGFRSLSAYGPTPLALSTALRQLNTHVDLMDWRGGRIGRPTEAVAADLAAALALARADGWRPVGVLAHHLVHDAAAWRTLDALLDAVSRHPAAEWRDAEALVAEAHDAGPCPAAAAVT
jgi:hypothetical protein